MLTTRAEKKKARTRFLLIYAFSLLLLLVVASAFWQKLAQKKQPETAAQAAGSETYFLQTDTVLHSRLAALDAASKAYAQSRLNNAEANTSELLVARGAMASTLDSIEQQAAYLNDGPKKATMYAVAAKFRQAMNDRETLLSSVVALPKLPVSAPHTSRATDSNETERLTRLLQEKEQTIAVLQSQIREETQAGTQLPENGEKDKLIASLQTQLRQKEAALQNALQAGSRPSASGGDWQQKYLSLKSAYEKTAASEKSLRNAYQTLSDDNRRLLSQLQSARKG